MKFYLIFWAIVIIFSLITFTVMSFKILYQGFPELLSMFKLIREQIEAREKEGKE
jgi:hypothetical protein